MLYEHTICSHRPGQAPSSSHMYHVEIIQHSRMNAERRASLPFYYVDREQGSIYFLKYRQKRFAKPVGVMSHVNTKNKNLILNNYRFRGPDRVHTKAKRNKTILYKNHLPTGFLFIMTLCLFLFLSCSSGCRHDLKKKCCKLKLPAEEVC